MQGPRLHHHQGNIIEVLGRLPKKFHQILWGDPCQCKISLHENQKVEGRAQILDDHEGHNWPQPCQIVRKEQGSRVNTINKLDDNSKTKADLP